MGDFEDLMTIAPTFLLMDAVLIVGYLAPYVIGKFDDMEVRQKIKKNKQYAGAIPRRWKCKCNAMLISHGCGNCMVLNDAGVDAWCPDCLDHPENPIAC